MSSIEKQLSQVSKTVSPFQTTGPTHITTTAPLPPLQVETITRLLDGTFDFPPARDIGPEDHYCPVNADNKHTLPTLWAGPGPIPCTKCGKNTGGVVR